MSEEKTIQRVERNLPSTDEYWIGFKIFKILRILRVEKVQIVQINSLDSKSIFSFIAGTIYRLLSENIFNIKQLKTKYNST